MSSTLSEVLSAMSRGRDLLSSMLEQTAEPAERAARVTETLHTLWPSSPLYGCLLRVDGEVYAHGRDETGQPRPEWLEPLREKLDTGVAGQGKAGRSARAARTLKLAGHPLIAEPIAGQEHSWGALAVAAPEEVAAETKPALHALLAACAERLAARLDQEDQERTVQTVRAELANQAWLADVGELAGPLTHAINNFLNVVSLHLAVLQQDLSGELDSELTEIRRQGASMAEVMKQFQQYRKPPPPLARPLDLNLLLKETVAEFERARATLLYVPTVHLSLAPNLPPVLGSSSDLKRLLTFLLKSATSFVLFSSPSVFKLRTEQAANCVVLRMEDSEPNPALESLAQMLAPGNVGPEDGVPMELVACKTLVRRLQGKISTTMLPEGGVAVLIALQAAK